MQIIIVLFGFFGFCISLYIFYKKNRKEDVVCLIQKKDCGLVVKSDYSKFFGIRLEILGMLYYGSIILGVLFLPSLLSEFSLHFFTICVTAMGAFFSLYLMAVQKWIIKTWCELCLGSAVASYSIFFLTTFVGI